MREFAVGFVGLVGLVGLLGCGGGNSSTLPDESADLELGGRGGRSLAGTRPAGPDLNGSEWRWVEAHCTEGPLELGSRGFQSRLRVKADPEGLLLISDQAFEAEGCVQTLMQRARPGETPDSEWQMVEEAHVSLPVDCGVAPEPDRPGDVRLRGDFLEVYVQRSVWCNGLEVRHVYARAQPEPLDGPTLVRHYAGHFARRDAAAVAGLFSDAGSLVEPFTESVTGTTRHEGRDAVYRWFQEAFDVPWLAYRLTSMATSGEGRVTAAWEYIDPRVEQPFTGQNTFTIAAGEIFETTFTLTGAAPEAGSPEDEEGGGDAEEEPGGEDPEAGEE